VKRVEQWVQSESIGAEGTDLRIGAAVGVDGVHGQPGVTRDAALADRCRGVLLGLAAGDRNGGPTELAVRLAESLADRRAFDGDDVLARYLAWWREGAFDTGPVAALVLERVACGVPVDKAVAQADRELGGQTAGCNPAHRAAPLAMAAFLADEILGDCAVQEAALTHAHPLAGDVAAALWCCAGPSFAATAGVPRCRWRRWAACPRRAGRCSPLRLRSACRAAGSRRTCCRLPCIS